MSEIVVAASELPGAIDSLDAHFERAERMIRRAASQGARLIVLPELCLTGYTLGVEMIERAVSVPGPTCDRLVAIARELDVVIVAGLSEREDDDVFDTIVVASGGGILGRYRKQFVSSAEAACFEVGTGSPIVETPIGRLGLGICADMVFESHWTPMRGNVDLVVISAGWPDFRRADGMPLGRAFRALHLRCASELPRRIGRFIGAPVVFANLVGPVELEPAIGPTIRARSAGRALVIDDLGRGTRAHDGLATARVRVKAQPPAERGAHWIPIGNTVFRWQMPVMDRLTAWVHRPIYWWRRAARARD